MTNVKEKIAKDLFDALGEANMGGTEENDLEYHHSRQIDLFGHLAESIKALGYEKEYLEYCENGECRFTD